MAISPYFHYVTSPNIKRMNLLSFSRNLASLQLATHFTLQTGDQNMTLSLSSSTVRELTPFEWDMVAGAGDEELKSATIVVVGERTQNMSEGSGVDNGGGTGTAGRANSTRGKAWAEWVDVNGDGIMNEPDEWIATVDKSQLADTRDGSFWGSFWVASGLGASASGGGGESHGSAGAGLGIGFEIGYSSDSGTAADNGDTTKVQKGGFDIDFDLDPFTISIKLGVGYFLPILEKHNDNFKDRESGGDRPREVSGD